MKNRIILPILSTMLFLPALWSGEALDYSMPAAKMAENDLQRQEFVIPPITLIKDGEFIVQKVRIINDSRNEEIRSNEIRETLLLIVNKSKENNFSIRFGQSNVTNDNYKDIPISSFQNKSDVACIKIEIKLDMDSKRNGSGIDDIEKSINSLKPVGRSEIVKEEFGIGITNPEKFRYELIAAIVKDVKTIQGMMGPEYSYNMTGLDKRIRWTRYNFNQLEIFIDYNFIFSVNGK